MKLKNNSLKVKIWKYLALFSIIIIAFLWLFQIMFLDSFYQVSKIKELNQTVRKAKSAFKNKEFYNLIENYSDQTGICIQLIENGYITYDSSMYHRSCNLQDVSYKQAFISSLLNEQTYKLNNSKFQNDVLVKAVRLSDNTFIFLSSSLQPMDNTIKILTDQLKILSIFVLFLAFIIGIFISKKISNPILKINKMATNMAKGDYENTHFFIEEDIDELNSLVKTLNTTCKELSKTEELNRELMANVSHDLKTPLTMIKAYAEMVRDLTYKNKEKREENLNVIIEESDRLNLLVNDIVLLSTLKSNTKDLEIESFDIVNLTKQIINRFAIIDYNLIINTDQEIRVLGDIKRIEQVMYNLITNAINYTGVDKTVKVNFEKMESNVRVSIIDTGKGIKEEDLKLIWKRYYKADKLYKRNKKGTGIGLSIVEEIFKKHGIEYGVNSKINEGTEFWFII